MSLFQSIEKDDFIEYQRNNQNNIKIICPALFPAFTLTTQHYINVCFESLSFYAKMQCFPFYLLSDFKRLQNGSSKPQCTAHVQSELGSLLRAGFCLFIFICARRYCLGLCILVIEKY